MAHYNTILNQNTAFIPRHNFDYHADIYPSGEKIRSCYGWSQFMAMLTPIIVNRSVLMITTGASP